MILYFLLDLPDERPLGLLDAFLPRLAGAWDAFDLVQVRAKEAAAALYVEAVGRVREVIFREVRGEPRLRRGPAGLERSEGGGRPLVLANDRVDVALASGADGVHVGAEDLAPESIRELDLLPAFVIGLTCHTLEELQAAPGRGADYLGVGAFFPSSTKRGPLPDPRPALHALPSGYALPVYAIGGIAAGRLREVAAAPHVRGIVVSSAVQGSPDPAAAARELSAGLAALGRSAER